MTDFYMVDAQGSDEEAYAKGISWLVDYATKSGVRDAAIVVPSLRQVESLAEKLGLDGNRLRKDRALRIGAVGVAVMISKDLSYRRFNGPMLGLWVDDDILPKMEDMDPSAICAIPWLHTDIQKWKAARAPIDLRTNQRPASPSISNAVVEVALRHLTHSVNLTTGILHPSDKDHAVSTFMALRDAGETYSAPEVRAWAVANGWSARHADDLAEVAEKIADGRKIRSSGRYSFRDDVVDRWRAEARGEKD